MAMPDTLPAVIKLGFNVTYVSAESGSSVGVCLTCKSSGGTCGYNVPAKAPACFCSDGSNRDRCAGTTPGMFFSILMIFLSTYLLVDPHISVSSSSWASPQT